MLDPKTIQITWNTKATDPDASLIAASQSGRFGLSRPVQAIEAASQQEERAPNAAATA